MKNPLVKLHSNDSDSHNAEIFVSAFALQAILPGSPVYAMDGEYVTTRTTGTGERSIGTGALVYFADDHHEVRESVKEVTRLFATKLRELATR